MSNLLHQMRRGAPARSRPDSLRRVSTDVPHRPAATDALFLVLRRVRIPLVLIVSVFTVMTFGLSLMPGTEENPQRLTIFDSFYIVSNTGLTIGFGEIPHPFSYPQRMWVTVTFYVSVVAWAYGVATVLALIQDKTFLHTIALQRFARKVRRTQEPFVLVVGYGQAGEAVCRALEDQDRAFVVLDADPARIQQLALDGYRSDHPALAADGDDPHVLGLAGLGHEHCEAVLALTDSDETNLSVVMSVNLLHPELQVIARCGDRTVARQMEDFAADVVINPFDQFGAYLVMALQHPVRFKLASWLLSRRGSHLPDDVQHLSGGRWVVCADGPFGAEVAQDLAAGGLEVALVDPADGRPDVRDAVGFVAGAESEITNLAMAAHARLENEDIFIAARQTSRVNREPVRAFDPDAIFIPTQLVAREAVARITAPNYWSFVEHAIHQDDAWAERVLAELGEVTGDEAPVAALVPLDPAHAPAAVRWLRRQPLTIEDILRDPDDRDEQLAAWPAILVRGGRRTFAPSLGTELREGDSVLLLGRERHLALVRATLFQDSAVEYVATGEQVATTWVFRQLQKRRRARRVR